MHNLFLGTPKRMIETWTTMKKMKNNDLLAMQTVAATMILPSDYTKLKTKIGKGFSHMKADEWKSWVLVYSPVLLKPVLPSNMFNGWMHYVKACRILTKHTDIYKNSVNLVKIHMNQKSSPATCTCTSIFMTQFVILDPCMAIGSLVLRDTMVC
ncbi:hypothetical protein PHYBLDRAFT_70941 [Phycomyces blakesleeanus NRRL 1555(-)]|uniref:Uncharacterized protein n=1 Tax=Phycomyces blakesleeanus (strain ATCC 8743b / DSM 1359 / FGSC 10004 / NBRC 33097 / NRRL 1555) TaxID=763407 RepID=A0A162PXA8_PHYB8|nr:hypothetical protein PHYBLDRAFT_70941 [Phycomyces blakesleeanus NRRL 1555(-)]OAD76867.1 hypothetical protein PHYBLDRAFT_70941 [Phycomyces blakesleeanus NRRL 1555(-)]|eukprot:XP_018294907.1 hypothetical protein PHYBLDRAFT_70941 [Phycomyces blakesleeanus NRRL 1555(-)]